ncbi:MAG: flagellar hook-basal body complex protein FliE [Clostridia bacterium]|nr:flagellar hook-basal body complex protein FliE [Clostridia bacterium]
MPGIGSLGAVERAVSGVAAGAGTGAGIESGRRTGQTDLVSTFGNVLEQALDTVNDMQTRADRLTEKLATGEVSDIHQVMIAVDQVNIALQLTMQVRNKVIESYQEIMRMQI